MQTDLILHAVPDADPEFLRIMGEQPDPPAKGQSRILAALPKMHELFLAKRQAAERKDAGAFVAVVFQEVELIKGLEEH
ncbi:MAG: hypothetical protein V1745_02810 [Patescibacteria group bacterium]